MNTRQISNLRRPALQKIPTLVIKCDIKNLSVYDKESPDYRKATYSQTSQQINWSHSMPVIRIDQIENDIYRDISPPKKKKKKRKKSPPVEKKIWKKKSIKQSLRLWDSSAKVCYGKYNSLFKTHEDQIKSMKKQQKSLDKHVKINLFRSNSDIFLHKILDQTKCNISYFQRKEINTERLENIKHRENTKSITANIRLDKSSDHNLETNFQDINVKQQTPETSKFTLKDTKNVENFNNYHIKNLTNLKNKTENNQKSEQRKTPSERSLTKSKHSLHATAIKPRNISYNEKNVNTTNKTYESRLADHPYPDTNKILKRKNEEIDKYNFTNSYVMGPLKRVLSKPIKTNDSLLQKDEEIVQLLYRTNVGKSNVDKYKKPCMEALKVKQNFRELNKKCSKDKSIFQKTSNKSKFYDKNQSMNETITNTDFNKTATNFSNKFVTKPPEKNPWHISNGFRTSENYNIQNQTQFNKTFTCANYLSNNNSQNNTTLDFTQYSKKTNNNDYVYAKFKSFDSFKNKEIQQSVNNAYNRHVTRKHYQYESSKNYQDYRHVDSQVDTNRFLFRLNKDYIDDVNPELNCEKNKNLYKYIKESRNKTLPDFTSPNYPKKESSNFHKVNKPKHVYNEFNYKKKDYKTKTSVKVNSSVNQTIVKQKNILLRSQKRPITPRKQRAKSTGIFTRTNNQFKRINDALDNNNFDFFTFCK